MKISFSDTEFFDLDEFSGNVYVEKSDGKGFSALLVNCVTQHYKTKMSGAKRMYLVLEGEGTFTINDKEEAAKPHDLFVIDDGDVYEYKGAMKLFEFNVPGTDESNERKVS